MSREFRVGDLVSWCGVEGVVGIADDHPYSREAEKHIQVKFGSEYVWFCHNGKYRSWHKEPSLFHVEDKVERFECEVDWDMHDNIIYPRCDVDGPTWTEWKKLVGKRGELIFIQESIRPSSNIKTQERERSDDNEGVNPSGLPTRREYFAAAALTCNGFTPRECIEIADKMIELLDSGSSSKDGK